MYIIQATGLNLGLTLLTRILQRASPYQINTSALNEYETPFHSFHCLRLTFGILLITNSILIAEDWTLRGILLYIVYWMPTVAWFEVFYSTRFKFAFFIGLSSAMLGMINALIFKSHPFYWSFAIAYSVFIAYLGAYYEYCIPKN